MSSESQVKTATVIRLAIILYAIYLTINLPGEIYSGIRSEPLFLFPKNPILGEIVVWGLKILLAMVGYLFAGLFSKLITLGAQGDIFNQNGIGRESVGIALFILAIYLFFEGLNDLTSVLAFAFNDKIGWSPFSGHIPNLFYESIRTVLEFAFAYVLVFKKSWLRGLSYGST